VYPVTSEVNTAVPGVDDAVGVAVAVGVGTATADTSTLTGDVR
jgi:hypothetical protein